MNKINLTFGKIAAFIAVLLIVIGVFGNWYVMDTAKIEEGDFSLDIGVSIFTLSNALSLDIPVDIDEFFSFGACGFLTFLAIILVIGAVFVLTVTFMEPSKISKYGSWGVGGLSVVTFFIALIGKPVLKIPSWDSEMEREIIEKISPDMAYGLILILIGGLLFALAPIIEEKLGANAGISFNTGASSYSPVDYGSVQHSRNTQNSLNQDKKFCSRCGAEVSNGAPFCTSCGNKVN